MRKAICLLLALACFAAGAQDKPGKAISERAIAAVKAGLKDPYSARFEGLRWGKKADGSNLRDTVCGSVNSKNSFGAYVGAKTFMYVDDGSKSYSRTEDDGALWEIAASICR